MEGARYLFYHNYLNPRVEYQLHQHINVVKDYYNYAISGFCCKIRSALYSSVLCYDLQFADIVVYVGTQTR